MKKILIIYTGGTFGMSANLKVPNISPTVLKKSFATRVPELNEIAPCEIDVLMNCDSAHIGPKEWVAIAQRIKTHQKSGRGGSKFAGVVVLHGTDTLPYTASALSFLLGKVNYPVIITGAQRPLSSLRSDARRNLVSAVEIAANGPRPLVNGVSVFFDDKLFYGTQVQKKSAVDYHAFESPYAPPLAEVGTEIRYLSARVDGAVKRKFGAKMKPIFSSKVALIHVTPGFPAQTFSENWLPHLEGVVMNIFPSGTGPTHDFAFNQMLKHARELKIPIVVVTEGGSNQPGAYEAGEKLLAEGCIWAGGMTTEFAFVKMALLLGQSAVAAGGIAGFKKAWGKGR